MNELLKVKKGDTVLIMKGKDRGKKGKVVRLFPKLRKVVVEGAGEHIRHTRPRRAGEKGQRVRVSHPLSAANVMVVCASCGKATRVGYRIGESGKARVCKKCGTNLSA